MPYAYISFGLIVLQSLLILTTNLNIWPEYFFHPWLVSHGYVPYKDFIFHHGPFLLFLLSPLSEGKDLLPLKLFYFLVQTSNLALVLAILRRQGSRLGFALFGFLYVLLSFYVNENSLTDEAVITTFFLTAYYLQTFVKMRRKNMFLGILVGVASLVKPTAAILLLPLFIANRSVAMGVWFSMVWIVMAVYFFFKDSIYELLDSVIFFNVNYGKYFAEHSKGAIGIKFLISIILAPTIPLFFSAIQKVTKRTRPLLFFLVASLVFFFPVHDKIHLPPFVAFLALYAGGAIVYLKGQVKKIALVCISLYILLMVGKVVQHREYLNGERIPYIENAESLEASAMERGEVHEDKNLYVLGNQIEIYYLSGRLPKTYFPTVFPFISDYYPDLEERIRQDIEENSLDWILVPKPQDENYRGLTRLKDYVKENYYLEKSTPEFDSYLRKQ